MLTYAGMTAPMAAASLYVWLKNPYGNSRAQVKVRSASKKELAVIALLTVPVTVLFYFILRYFGTASIIPSTLSVATSFLAVSLTLRRCALYALAYAMNDIVLIALWLPASFDDTTYVPMLTCFAVFLVHDIYGFFNWNRLRKLQTSDSE
jgi:nicotinamide mononucleotide transporter PnuC